MTVTNPCVSEHEKSQQCSLLSADEIAEFLTKTELKKYKNSPKILLDGYHLSALILISAKKILKPCRRKEANVLMKVYEEERLLKKKLEPNSITVNFIYLGETIWFSCLSIKQ